MKKRICPVCGKKSDSRLESCPYCGAVFPTSGSDPGKKDTFAGDPWDPDGEQETRQPQETRKTRKKRGRKALLCFLFAAVLLALAAVGAWSESEQEGTTEDTAGETTESEVVSEAQTAAIQEVETEDDYGGTATGLGRSNTRSDGVSETVLCAQRTDTLETEEGKEITPEDGKYFLVFTFLDTAEEGKASVCFYDVTLTADGTDCAFADDSENIYLGGVKVDHSGYYLESGMSSMTDIAFEVPENAEKIRLTRMGTWFLDLDESEVETEVFDASSVAVPGPALQEETTAAGADFTDSKGLVWTYDGFSLTKQGTDPEKMYLCLKFTVTNPGSSEVETEFYSLDYRIFCDGLMLRPDDVYIGTTEDGYESIYFAGDIGAGESLKISLGLVWNSVLDEDAVKTMNAYLYEGYEAEEPFVTISDRFQ